jgi:hypothetical protein
MAGTDITDTLLTAGQNEGVERSVLPMPQLATVVNARLRKQSRWGKRYGHTSLSTTNLGTGSNLPRCIGGQSESGFVVVDDRCSSYNRTAARFETPNKLSAGFVANAVSGWLPDTSFLPVPSRSLQRQTVTPCSITYFGGYVWTAMSYTNPLVATDKVIRVTAADPTDQTIVFETDITATISTFGGVSYPKLLSCGGILVLTYLYAPSAGNLRVNARSLFALSSGFGADTNLSAINVTGYDASNYTGSGTQFLVAATRNGAGTTPVLLVNAIGLANVATQLFADSSGNPITTVGVVGSTTAGVFLAYGVSAISTSRVAVFPVGLGASTGAATLTATSSGTPLPCLLSNNNVRVVFENTGGGTSGTNTFSVLDVTSAGTTVGSVYKQSGCAPIGFPFLVGTQVYMWTRLEMVASVLGHYATLIRLPTYTEFTSLPTGSRVNCPLEMSVQDFPIGIDSSIDLLGVPRAVQVGSAGTYAAVVPILYASPPDSGLFPGYDFRVLQVKHYSDTASVRSVSAMYADTTSFVPMGTLTRVDDRGPVEEGFVCPPGITATTPAAGGSMTASSDYYYSLVFKSRNSNGRYEQSQPSAPTKVTMAAAQTQVTLAVTPLLLGARDNAQIEVYRSLSNTQTFYLTAVIDAKQDEAGVFPLTLVDRTADGVLAARQALYTQVGQTLPNAFPPASRFGCVGGQRLFLGGLIRSDLVQASKLIFGDQSPTFCDSDAFRIVLPAACTGLAWMDVLVMFTAEGIYIASGDGPSDDGLGDFGNLTRMPYELGCIEPRSVKVIDDGCFFQTSRGLYLLPRGFGAPVPAGDNVMETLRSFPVITGAATVTKDQEQSVLWSCVESTGGFGARVVYDIAHKAWSVDKYPSQTGTANASTCGMGQWLNGEVALFSGSTTRGLQVTSGGFAEADGSGVAMSLETGDLRPFGTMSEGIISKIDLLAELRSACTLNVTKTTENNTASTSRVFALAAGDYNLGSLAVTETELGNSELRDVMSLRVQYSETSTSEGLAFIALSVEHEQGQGLKRVSDLSRNT